MKIYIYDIEVFSDDWIVVFRDPESDYHTVIHNDNHYLREFLSQPDIVIGGFNNKHYDDWIILTMLLGGSNVEVKKHNDFIIEEGRNGWEFPFIQFKKRTFKSFDLRDDIADEQISLKAIEGNLKLPIVESSVPFNIDRKLTPEELEKINAAGGGYCLGVGVGWGEGYGIGYTKCTIIGKGIGLAWSDSNDLENKEGNRMAKDIVEVVAHAGSKIVGK